MPSLISPEDVTALVETTLTTDQLQAVIDREEAELAGIIGPLTGDRTEVFLLTSDHQYARITLRRPTDAVEITDNGVDVDEGDFRLLADQRTIQRFVTAAGNPYVRGYWLGPVEATYEPNDVAHVQRVLIDLVSLGFSGPSSIASGDLASETIGTYSYTRARTTASTLTNEQRRRALIASLLPRSLPTTIHVRSSVFDQRGLLGTVRPA